MTGEVMELNEAEITIGDVRLSQAEAMTVRVALSSFIMRMAEEGLGNEAHGKEMTRLYLQHSRRVERLLVDDIHARGGR